MEGLSNRFCFHQDTCWDTKEQTKGCTWKMSDGQKTISDFYVSFDCTHQDNTFVTKIQSGAQRDGAMNENGKCQMATTS